MRWAFALFGKRPAPAAPGRAVVASGFLLGTVSGSGVATTVTLASLSWPMLKRSGYNPATAGGLTAAAGIGATLSPPTLGAAAFIIAEYLDISYLDVLVMATIPTVLMDSYPMDTASRCAVRATASEMAASISGLTGRSDGI